jgi:transposase
MLHAGLDLSRRRLDVCILSDEGELVARTATPPDADGLAHLVAKVGVHEQPIAGVIESMTGARFVRDVLAEHGWHVQIADAHKVKGLAPLACKTDKIDAQVLARLSQLDLVPAIWLPDPETRSARELARFRLHLIKHRSSLKNRIHATLINFGKPCPVSDLFGVRGRQLLTELDVPERWRQTIEASLRVIDHLDEEVTDLDKQLRRSGADHHYVPLLQTVPGIGWILSYTIAAEIGAIERFATPAKLCGYTGLCPRVIQSGNSDRRGPLSKHGPPYLRWALLEATLNALRHPPYRERYERKKKQLGRQRGAKVAQVDLARRLTTAIWHMLTRNEPFAPAGAGFRLAA